MVKKILVGVACALTLAVTLAARGGDLGSITAGSITGVTAVFGGGGGSVTLNSSGITLTAGTDNEDKIKWTDGGVVYSNSDTLWATSDGPVILLSGGGSAQLQWNANDSLTSSGGTGILGVSSGEWDAFLRHVRITDTAGAGATAFVCADNDGDLYASAGTCDGSAPAPSAEVIALRREVAELRTLLQQLAAQQ